MVHNYLPTLTDPAKATSAHISNGPKPRLFHEFSNCCRTRLEVVSQRTCRSGRAFFFARAPGRVRGKSSITIHDIRLFQESSSCCRSLWQVVESESSVNKKISKKETASTSQIVVVHLLFLYVDWNHMFLYLKLLVSTKPPQSDLWLPIILFRL